MGRSTNQEPFDERLRLTGGQQIQERNRLFAEFRARGEGSVHLGLRRRCRRGNRDSFRVMSGEPAGGHASQSAVRAKGAPKQPHEGGPE